MSSKVQPTGGEAFVKGGAKVANGKHEEGTTVMVGHVGGPETRTIISQHGGHKLHCYYWKPNDTLTIRGLVYLSHGFAEYLSWYEELAQRFAAEGILAFGHDHVGHGRSDGIRCHVDSVMDYGKDILQHCDDVTKQHPNLPLFLLGHSMGGMIAVRTAMEQPNYFQGVVLMGPLLVPNPSDATPIMKFLAKLVSRVLPHVTVANLNVDLVTRDEDMIARFKKDDLRYTGGIRSKWAVAVMSTLDYIAEHVDQVQWPFIIQHGEQDKICMPTGSEDFHKRAQSTDKHIKLYPEAYHHLYCEISEVRREVMKDSVDWVIKRITDDVKK